MPFEPLPQRTRLPEAEQIQVAQEWLSLLSSRRTVRHFSSENIAEEVLLPCLLAASKAPSGANLQPWHFAVIRDPATKHQIRIAAEKEEREFYQHRAPQAWLDALAPLGTDAEKPFLEIAPVLIAVFVQSYGLRSDGSILKHYYATESVGIACGLLIAGLHRCGIATLTHTPSPMNFLNAILHRPENERPFLLLVAGYPSADAQVPTITKKSLSEFTSFH